MPVDAPEDLYGLPLERFIPERTALVKALRAEKRREEANEVAALRKPSVAAWAVNQLVRTQPKAIRALFEAGDALAKAQQDAAEGRHSGEAMREATRRQRQAVAELTEAAEGLLGSEGNALSPSTLEHVADTLRAAAIDEDARRQVQGGCLTHEIRFAGLGLAGLGAASAPAAPPPKRSTQDKKTPPPRRSAKQAAAAPKAKGAQGEEATTARAEAQTKAKAEAEADRRRAARTAARKAETQARRAATRADKELTAAQRRRDEAAAAVDEAGRTLAEADDALTAAQQGAEQATADLKAAEQAVKDLGDT